MPTLPPKQQGKIVVSSPEDGSYSSSTNETPPKREINRPQIEEYTYNNVVNRDDHKIDQTIRRLVEKLKEGVGYSFELYKDQPLGKLIDDREIASHQLLEDEDFIILNNSEVS